AGRRARGRQEGARGRTRRAGCTRGRACRTDQARGRGGRRARATRCRGNHSAQGRRGSRRRGGAGGAAESRARCPLRGTQGRQEDAAPRLLTVATAAPSDLIRSSARHSRPSSFTPSRRCSILIAAPDNARRSGRTTMADRRAALAIAAAIASAAPTGTAGAEDSFQGKQITIHVGSGPGGAYDTFARLLARHVARHIPGNPAVVVTNVPGASGRRMINYIYNVAPRDGTAIGTGLSTLAFDPLMGEASQFDAQKLAWIGSSNKQTAACIIWDGSAIKTIEDVKRRTTAVGSSGPSSTDSIYPNVLNALFGMQFKVVQGYASAPEMSLAIERGELDGRCGLTWSSLQ